MAVGTAASEMCLHMSRAPCRRMAIVSSPLTLMSVSTSAPTSRELKSGRSVDLGL